jgi:hypothetical protein
MVIRYAGYTWIACLTVLLFYGVRFTSTTRKKIFLIGTGNDSCFTQVFLILRMETLTKFERFVPDLRFLIFQSSLEGA